MGVWIHHIETAVPDTFYTQDYVGTRMDALHSDTRVKRILRAIYRKSGIEKRHSVVDNFLEGEDSFFKPGRKGGFVEPGTAERNEIYGEASRPLAVGLARKTIEGCPGIEIGDITHLITVSCTGFYNPGMDHYIIEELGLTLSTQRFNIGFMGCYAGITGLRMASHICVADPGAVVLVLSLELCTLHMKLNGNEDNLLANSLFGDGAAAALVSSQVPERGRRVYRMGPFLSRLIPDGKGEMTWRVGDFGFDMTLSSYVPKIIASGIQEILEPLFEGNGLSMKDVATWAVHPGGKSIVDGVKKSLGLSHEQVYPSREVLREYGNMSSATILFVLKKALEMGGGEESERVCAIAFGPGLTVEMAILDKEE